MREIFQRHTDLIEPLSLDEAYLDVTENKTELTTATRVAKMIRQEIREELHLTASAGVAPNKFLAKIASDWKKPDGLFVIQPHEVQDFLLPLPVGRIPGVGRVTETRMKEAGIRTVGDLYALELSALEDLFGSYGARLYQLARGVDHNPVVPNRVSKSISKEDTFETDIPLADTVSVIRTLAEKVWTASRNNARAARTVVLKLKTKEFSTLTRSHTPTALPSTCAEFTDIALSLCERVELGSQQLYRLVGVGLSNFQVGEDIPSPLFEERSAPLQMVDNRMRERNGLIAARILFTKYDVYNVVELRKKQIKDAAATERFHPWNRRDVQDNVSHNTSVMQCSSTMNPDVTPAAVRECSEAYRSEVRLPPRSSPASY